MDKRYVKKMDSELSRLGLGCMRFPTIGDKIDRIKAGVMLDALIAAGVNYFDTGYSYHNSDSEVWLSEALIGRYPRESFHLADKLPLRLCNEPSDLEKVFATQMGRLKTDYIDFYLMHDLRVSEWNRIGGENVIKFLEKKQAEGKIRKKGFSFHETPENLKILLDAYDWDFVQIQFNFYDNEIQRAGELYSLLESRGIPTIVMEPVRGGSLANLRDDVSEIFHNANSDASIPSWALRWVASHPNVQVVLSGMSNMEHVNDNIATFSPVMPLNEQEYEVIRAVVDKIKSLPTIPCTKCRYCVEGCPQGIDIPELIERYNDYIRFSEPLFKRYYRELTGGSSENNCISCGACSAVCPQHIDVPDALVKIHDAAAAIEKEA